MNRALSVRELADHRPAGGLLGLAERGLLPDAAIRAGIRRLLRQRLATEAAGGIEAQSLRLQQLLARMASSPVAVHADAANRQHYALPAAFFQACLGPRLKYSSCYYPSGRESLAEAEEAMLDLTCLRAGIEDGHDILELGCGWGSLTLFMAERFPRARITAVSNSAPQRAFIERCCAERGIANVRVVTADVSELQRPARSVDRCVSVEMFEHLRNPELLMSRIAGWLRPGGLLFVHVFCHRTLAYPFETEGADNWMGRHFFTGGLMPAADTLSTFQRDLLLQERWLLDGRHYQRTAEHWLQRQDAARGRLLAVLREVHGDAAPLWFQRWRMFFMSCAELFGHARGQQWLVAHYRFVQP